MRDVALFVEDDTHRQIIGPLVNRMAEEPSNAIRLQWRRAGRGHGTVVNERRTYIRGFARRGSPEPDLVIVVTGAICPGLNERTREIQRQARDASAPLVFAIPDSSVESWLLLDGAASRTAVGRGCDAPEQERESVRCTQRLIEAIRDAGVTPILGGREYAEDIIREMNIDRAAQADRSLARFVSDLRAKFREWRT